MSHLEDLSTLVRNHPWQTCALVLASYVVLCNLLRFRRVNQKHAQLPYKTTASFRAMTAEHAWEIQKYLFDREFPFTSLKALQFALFRTYGIPSISKLLVETKQLSDLSNAPKRYTDTEVLIQEFTGYAPSSERANAAIARMNYLHSRYRKSGKISNGDMLYTLALFALEPMRWINRYEWRKLTPMEVCALGTFWKSIGDAMEISYDELPSSKSEWRDGLHWHQEMDAWSQEYEKKYMVPDDKNKKTADETTAILLYDLPQSMKGVGLKVVSALMDDRLRKAMMYAPPPASYKRAVDLVFGIRAFVLRYFALPRPDMLRVRRTTASPDKEGRYHMLDWDAEPWYVENTFANRWSARSWFKWILGRPYPGSGQYRSQGYLVQDVGPTIFEGKGQAEFRETKERLMVQGRGGCPFAF